jgi:hypothetical protein
MTIVSKRSTRLLPRFESWTGCTAASSADPEFSSTLRPAGDRTIAIEAGVCRDGPGPAA